MTEINHKKDPLALFYDEDIYFPFEVPATNPETPPAQEGFAKSAHQVLPFNLASVFLSEPDSKSRSVYAKILSAINRQQGETPELVTLTPQMDALISFLKEHACDAVILWGIQPEELGIELDYYQLKDFFGIQFLLSHSIQELESDQGNNKKRQLWSVLRANFQN